jgi:hypothetical protein
MAKTKKKTKKRFEEKEIKLGEKRTAGKKEEILQLYNTSENESISKTTH